MTHFWFGESCSVPACYVTGYVIIAVPLKKVLVFPSGVLIAERFSFFNQAMTAVRRKSGRGNQRVRSEKGSSTFSRPPPFSEGRLEAEFLCDACHPLTFSEWTSFLYGMSDLFQFLVLILGECIRPLLIISREFYWPIGKHLLLFR